MKFLNTQLQIEGEDDTSMKCADQKFYCKITGG